MAQTHHCSCCGKRGHTIQTCPMPAAKEIIKLKKALLAAKQIQPVPRRGQRVRKRPASFRQLRRARGDKYSGSTVKETLLIRKNAKRRMQGLGLPTSDMEAYSHLVGAGFLDPPPKRCPACKRGALSKPQVYKKALVARCSQDGCQARFNVIKFSKLKSLWERSRSGRGFCCMNLFHLFRCYTNPVGSTSPRAAQAGISVGVGVKAPKRLFDELRSIEARAAACENKRIKLGGNVETQSNIEGDGTVVRKIYVSRKNALFKKHVKEAEQRLARRGKLAKEGRLHDASWHIDDCIIFHVPQEQTAGCSQGVIHVNVLGCVWDTHDTSRRLKDLADC